MFKNKLTNESLDLKGSIYKRITNPFYLIAVALTAIGTYGFYLANPSPSIDWLSYDSYYNGLLFGQGRFTATIVEKVFGLWNCPVWFEPILGLVCFILGTLIMLAVFDGFTDYKSIVPSIVFTCIYITFPLLPEYFIYNGAILTVGGSTLLLSLAIYLEIKYKDLLRSMLIPTILMIAVFSWYECMILPYVGAVFAVFYLLNRENHDLKTKFVITKGLYFAMILIASIVLEYAVTTAAIKIFSIPLHNGADVAIHWENLSSVLYLLANYASYWFIKAFCYAPFTILFVFLFIFLIMSVVELVRYKKFSSVIIFFGMLIPVFAMTVIRCGGGALYRIEQGMPFFIAFVSYAICLELNQKKSVVKRIIAAAFCFLLTVQIGTSNYSYFVNSLRYEEEKNVILTVNSEITSKFESDKPVVFIGEYKISDSLQEKRSYPEGSFAAKLKAFAVSKSPVYQDQLQEIAKIRVKFESVGSSYLGWSVGYFEEDYPLTELYKFCDYIGVSFEHCTKEQFEDAKQRYADLPSYPNKGYAAENDEYIVVKLGDVYNAN